MHLGYALTSTFSKIPIELLVMEENLHRNICLRGKSHQIGTFFKKKKNGVVWTSTTKLEVFQKLRSSRLPGSPVFKTPRFRCRGPRFDPWSGN